MQNDKEVLLFLFDFSPFDHGFRRPVDKYKLGEKFLLQFEFSRLPHHVEVHAQLVQSLHAGQLLEHDVAGRAAEEYPHKLTNHYDHRDVEAHHPGCRQQKYE